MAPILPAPSQEPRFNRITHTYSPFEGTKTSGRENTQGSIYSVRFRVVCRECNNGWMSDLEMAARPYLTPLITGEPVLLDREKLNIIAQWIALKVMVAEHSDPNSAVTPRPERLRFRQSRTIPEFMQIYVATHELPFEKAVGYRRDSQCVAFNSAHLSPPLGDVPNNIQAVLFFLGRVFVYVTSARVDNLKIEDILLVPQLYETCCIWPQTIKSAMGWPRIPAFTTEQVNELSMGFQAAFNAQTSRWIKKSRT